MTVTGNTICPKILSEGLRIGNDTYDVLPEYSNLSDRTSGVCLALRLQCLSLVSLSFDVVYGRTTEISSFDGTNESRSTVPYHP